MKPYLRDQMNALKREAELMSHPQSNAYKPLELQLQELMLSTPPALLARPWAMSEFIDRLTGKYRASPHAQNVAIVLLKAGWKPIRLWGSSYLGKRYWILNNGVKHDHTCV